MTYGTYEYGEFFTLLTHTAKNAARACAVAPS